MTKFLLNLQLFAEGGDGGAAGTAEGVGDAGSQNAGVTEGVGGSQSLVTSNEGPDKATAFEDLIKGEYKDEYDKRVQSIIKKRFAKQEQMEAERKALNPILEILSQKYGMDASDPEALAKAVLEDDSYYEEEALERGLSIRQLKEIKAMERENAELRAMREQAEQQRQDEMMLAKWQDQAEEFKAKYGMADFDFMKEAAENDDFRKLLATGTISVETAYMATHINDVIPATMAKTAQAVRQGISENMQARSGRPSENGLSSNATAVIKIDPAKLTKEQMRDLEARAARGERITF